MIQPKTNADIKLPVITAVIAVGVIREAISGGNNF